MSRSVEVDGGGGGCKCCGTDWPCWERRSGRG